MSYNYYDEPDDSDYRHLCHYCGGEGYGIVGTDWDNDDPINDFDLDGTVQRCPCCRGSGKAEDCVFG